jgi:hypothetical protein
MAKPSAFKINDKNAEKPYKIRVGWGLEDEKDTRKY